MSRRRFDDSKSNTRTQKTSAKPSGSRSRSNKSRNRGKDYKSVDSKSLEEATQDPQFYFKNPELQKHVASIPFNVISNLPAPISDGTFQMPSIVVYKINLVSPCTPSLGTERNTNMNQMMQDLYAQVRRENSGARNYDPADLTRFIFAMAGVFQRINYLQRIYMMMPYVSALNRAFPIALFRAMHLDWEDFRNNQANFAARLDLLIDRVRTMQIPTDIAILHRISEMYKYYYIDTEDMRDTLYIPIPGSEGCLDLDNLENLTMTSGGLYTAGSSIKLATMDQIMTDAEAFVSKVLASQDFGIMQGDLLHAFPNMNYTQLESLKPGASLPPIYDKAKLMQFHNADVLTSATNYHSATDHTYLAFDQSTGQPKGSYVLGNTTNNPYYMQFAETIPSTHPGTMPTLFGGNLRSDTYLCLDSDELSEEWIVECSRMKVGAGVDIIEDVLLMMPMPSELLNWLITHQTNNPSDVQVFNSYGDFPYITIIGNSTLNGAYQHAIIPVWVPNNMTTSQYTVYNDKVARGIFDTYFEGQLVRVTQWNDWSKFMSIARFLPYQIRAIVCLTGGGSNVAYSVVPDNNAKHYYEWVNTSFPVIQPVPNVQMDRISNICWRSLLTLGTNRR